jgi:hypothetical protein
VVESLAGHEYVVFAADLYDGEHRYRRNRPSALGSSETAKPSRST